ncbi:hypothetical protein [Actinokineospora fastidiosa]|uniref:Lipoprotein n=1 Tax=Actinokineospora fastidiosa TaxID=1816 RepID=A0A918GU73_9PSEU|nr:hypothetical protein [Actinokineospora fastidiosa]GGS58319.1 hypothetical protein GCM10010171_61590 [Actinokineospora fastidiosa]
MTLRGIGAVVAVVGMLVSGCSSTDRRDAVIERIKADPGMADAPQAAVDCIADWYAEHASDAEYERFVAGEPAEDTEPQAGVVECVKQAM